MYKLSGTHYIDSAHFLEGHGKCANLHGHRWAVKYCLISEHLVDSMVIDFADIKNIAKQLIEPYDHALFCTHSDSCEYTKFIASCKQMRFKVIEFPFKTTAENLAKFFYQQFQNELRGYGHITVSYIEVFETANNAARYET